MTRIGKKRNCLDCGKPFDSGKGLRCKPCMEKHEREKYGVKLKPKENNLEGVNDYY